ncbi:MAG TPA: hypothetical protein VF285_12450 [Castellaniella sp.]|uniref:hypothetical protein n=1 Tax=Castellaniella sp. TaxID=1955812 RepID=UPI002F1B40FB
MTDTPPDTDPIARYRAVLEALDPRLRIASKLRAVFPLIEAQIDSGVPHAAVLDDLKAAGLPVQTSTYTTTLYRWRKAKRQAADETDQPRASVAEPSGSPTTKPSSPPLPAIQGRPNGIQTPGDLRKIRDMRIDLDALRREGLANRAKTSQDTKTQNDKE